jgi:phage regulator Rha-like protein
MIDVTIINLSTEADEYHIEIERYPTDVNFKYVPMFEMGQDAVTLLFMS